MQNRISSIVRGGVLSAVFLLAGCETLSETTSTIPTNHFIVEVDSISDPNAFPDLSEKKYVVSSSMQNVGDQDLEFKQVARWVGNALNGSKYSGEPAKIEPALMRKYTLVENREDADVLIRIAYGIGEPQTTTSTYTTAPGYSYPIGSWWYSVPPSTETVKTTTYTRRLVVEAYDLKKPGKLPQIWKINLLSRGSSGVLMDVLPYMIACGGPFISTSGGHKVQNISHDAAGKAVAQGWVGAF